MGVLDCRRAGSGDAAAYRGRGRAAHLPVGGVSSFRRGGLPSREGRRCCASDIGCGLPRAN